MPRKALTLNAAGIKCSAEMALLSAAQDVAPSALDGAASVCS